MLTRSRREAKEREEKEEPEVVPDEEQPTRQDSQRLIGSEEPEAMPEQSARQDSRRLMRSERPEPDSSEALRQELRRLQQRMSRLLSAKEPSRRVLKLRPYSGENAATFRAYLRQFEDIARFNRWSPDEKLMQLVGAMTGKALQKYSRAPRDKISTYDDLVQYLTKANSPFDAEVHFRDKLDNLHQAKSEECDDYLERALELFARFEEISGETVSLKERLRTIVRGVRDEYKQVILLEDPFSIDDLARAMTKAVRVARAGGRKKLLSHQSVPTEEQPSPSPTPGSDDALLGRLNALMAAHARRPQRRPFQGTCFQCGEKGHMRRECPKVGPARSSGVSRCKICRRGNHTEDRCWVAHPELRPSQAVPRTTPTTCWLCNGVMGTHQPRQCPLGEQARLLLQQQARTAEQKTTKAADPTERGPRKVNTMVADIGKLNLGGDRPTTEDIAPVPRDETTVDKEKRALLTAATERDTPRVAKCVVQVNGTAVEAILDTGADVSMMSRQFAETQGLHLTVSKDGQDVRMANQTSLKPIGSTTVVLKIGSASSCPLSFLVDDDFCYSLLLGMDSLERLGARIDVNNKTVFFSAITKTLPLLRGGQEASWHSLVNNALQKNEPPMRQQQGEEKDGHKEFLDYFDFYKDKTIPSDKRERLADLLRKYERLFFRPGKQLGQTTAMMHKIRVKEDVRPIHVPPYRTSPKEREIIKRHIDDMLKLGVIRPSRSPWASPVVLVPKQNGKLRFCVDFRQLNKVTEADAYPLPRIDTALESLNGSTFYSSLDLAAGYWQIKLEPESCKYTAFVCTEGLFEFVVLPFGLHDAPAAFQRLMDNVLADLKYRELLWYLDDVLCFSKTFDSHLAALETVFRRFAKAGLMLRPEKCKFLRTKTKFLGHIVSAEGISVDNSKVDAVADFPVPTNRSSLRSFLGLTGYYRRFIKSYAEIADPLHALLKKDVRWMWSDAQRTAFNRLKEVLMSTHVLVHPDFSKQFVLQTDASSTAIGAVLSQEDRPVAYASRRMTKAERNYAVREQEALAIVWAVKKFRPFLLSAKFTVQTDHASLRWLMETKTPGKIARWALALSEYTFDIVHRPGRANGNADALSRQVQALKRASEPAKRTVLMMTRSQRRGQDRVAPAEETPISRRAERRGDSDDAELGTSAPNELGQFDFSAGEEETQEPLAEEKEEAAEEEEEKAQECTGEEKRLESDTAEQEAVPTVSTTVRQAQGKIQTSRKLKRSWKPSSGTLMATTN